MSRGFPSVAAVLVLESVTAAAVVVVLAEVALLVTAKKCSTVNCWLLFTADLWFSDSIWDLTAFRPIVQSLKALLQTLQNPKTNFNQVRSRSYSNHFCWNLHFPISWFFCLFSSLRSEHVATLQVLRIFAPAVNTSPNFRTFITAIYFPCKINVYYTKNKSVIFSHQKYFNFLMPLEI